MPDRKDLTVSQYRPSRSSGFRPTLKVDVYDQYAQRTLGREVKVAEVLSDGARGEVRILDPAFKDVVEEIMAKPRVRGERTFYAGDERIRTQGEALQPWTEESLRATFGELRFHNLRAVLTQQ